ncbi:hypothetical protein D779_0632 [Imhoffiella purpurea]|uniref:Uncharacterized protein n=1 Tax=Imhoffiella purpurea TaxID=1249627 RepID=W9V8S7_9GAMM|nr:hypothetical protein D779_0632 [Imhoffiella purpurea]
MMMDAESPIPVARLANRILSIGAERRQVRREWRERCGRAV